jgi:hypothetical protein
MFVAQCLSEFGGRYSAPAVPSPDPRLRVVHVTCGSPRGPGKSPPKAQETVCHGAQGEPLRDAAMAFLMTTLNQGDNNYCDHDRYDDQSAIRDLFNSICQFGSPPRLFDLGPKHVAR